MVRSTWTDERLEDFREHVDQRFDAVDQRFDAVDRRFDGMEDRLSQNTARIDALHHSITTFATATIAVLGANLATLLGLLITQI